MSARRIVVEELDDGVTHVGAYYRMGESDNAVSDTRPSVSERHDASALLYLYDSPHGLDELVTGERLESLLEQEMLADAVGSRMLAVSGREIDDDALMAAQTLLAQPTFDAFIEQRERLPLPALARNFFRSKLGPFATRSAMRSFFVPGPDREQHDLSSLFTPARRLPSHLRPLRGGYFRTLAGEHARGNDALAFVPEAADDDDDFGTDEDYLDYVGSQLLARVRGHPCWIIERRSATDEDGSTLLGIAPAVEERA